MPSKKGNKQAFQSIAEKNAVLENILTLLLQNENILILGHELPDEDCIAALVSLSIVLKKFNKNPYIYIHDSIPDQLLYMANICSYNKIPVFTGKEAPATHPDVICILDTPKPSMIALNPSVSAFLKETPVAEIDHHLYADAEYCGGNPEYRYVDTASSTCELLATICCKLNKRKGLLQAHGIKEFFTRNLALTLLTGMIGDTKFGLTLKTNREKFFYNYFTKYFAKILEKAYRKNSGNYANITDIFTTIQQLSPEEKEIYQQLLDFASFSTHIGFIFLSAQQSEDFVKKYDTAMFVKVIKSVTDFLAEKSGRIGVTSYYDESESVGKIQYRLRAARGCTDIDFREILTDFKITDGGGHPGAVGFRLETAKYSGNKAEAFNKKLRKKLDEI